jgi:hypothetical protein
VKRDLAQVSAVLRDLLAAVPEAWREDRVFRWASIGAAACLLGMFANSGAKQLASVPGVPPPPLPPPTVSAAPSPAPAPRPPLPTPSSAEPPRIAPGRPLSGAVITQGASEADRFGILQPRR